MPRCVSHERLFYACALRGITFPATGARPRSFARHGASMRVRVGRGVSQHLSVPSSPFFDDGPAVDVTPDGFVLVVPGVEAPLEILRRSR
jgi:hypothetical protein